MTEPQEPRIVINDKRRIDPVTGAAPPAPPRTVRPTQPQGSR